MAQLNALPQGSLVLVTGANGYIGSNIANALLQQGLRVRGTVRSSKPWLDELFSNKYGKGSFESVIVTQIDNEDALTKAMDGVSGVVHVASDVSFNVDPNAVIPFVVKATENLLSAASKHSSIKRVVLTSSSSAVLIPATNQPGVRVDEDTWDDAAVKAAWDPNTPASVKGFFIYAASKTEGERAAWRWMEQNKPGFVFNTVLPNLTIGEILHPEIHGSTMSWIRDLLKGDQTALSRIGPQYWVDVGDVARLHAIALLGDSVKSQRIFGFAGEFNKSDIFDALRELRPDNKLIPSNPTDEGRDLTDVVPAAKAEQLLRNYYGQKSWVPFKESLAAGIRGL